MKPRIAVITIGVDDLERSLKFYRDGLGLRTEGIIGTELEHGAVALFEPKAAGKPGAAARLERRSRGITLISGNLRSQGIDL